jgi:hypothetical protein
VGSCWVGFVFAVRVVRQYPFTPERKMMSTLVALDPRNPDNGPVRLYVTGKCGLCVCAVCELEVVGSVGSCTFGILL